jgi:amino acid adenylation domain-containing protein
MKYTNQPPNDFEPFPRSALDQSINARFEATAQRFPDKQAVRTKKYSWTYTELNARATKIAQAISTDGVSGAAPILIQFDHDAPAIAAVLGVLKSGNFYCALDTGAGVEPSSTLLRSLNPQMLLCDGANLARSRNLANDTIPVLNTENIQVQSGRKQLQLHVPPDALAYVFFTSGTTGQPKGVMDCHRNVLHNILRYTSNLRISSDDRLTLLQTLSFSGSLSSLFCALLNGATVYPFDLRQEGSAALADWIAEQRITVYHSVPSIFRLIAGEGKRFPHLRVLRLEGDRASSRDAVLFQQNFPRSCVLVNGLGATECGIVRQHFLGVDSPLPAGVLPLGHAVEDMEVSLLDEQGQPALLGEVGEIAVRSRFLAVGYWQRPDLTASAFKPEPGDPQMRTYRAGDLGRLDGEGCLDYLGRKDFQEKVSGQRVSLAHIEAELLRIDGILEAAAAVKPNRAGDNQLVAYYTELTDCPADPEKIWRDLRIRLEGHMLPSALIRLDRLPLNANGKIDRRALPEPSRRRLLPYPVVQPSAADEAALVAIWRDILDLDEIGVEDSFIELGGNSLQAMQMLNRVLKVFGNDVPISEFFAAPRIIALGQKLRNVRLEFDDGVELNASKQGRQ